MRLLIVVGAVLFVWQAGAVTAQQPQESPETKAELKKFQGKWKAVDFTVGGVQVPLEQIKATSMVIEGKKYTIKTKDNTIHGTFSVDVRQNPLYIDATVIDANGKKSRIEGIYEWINGRRRTCFSFPGRVRPREFMPDQGYVTLEWKKVK